MVGTGWNEQTIWQYTTRTAARRHCNTPSRTPGFTYLVPTMPTNWSARKIRTITRIPIGAPTTGYGGFETWQKQRGVEASVDELVEILQYLYIELKKKDGTDYEWVTSHHAGYYGWHFCVYIILWWQLHWFRLSSLKQAIVFKKTWYVSARLGISSRIMQRTWYLEPFTDCQCLHNPSWNFQLYVLSIA